MGSSQKRLALLGALTAVLLLAAAFAGAASTAPTAKAKQSSATATATKAMAPGAAKALAPGTAKARAPDNRQQSRDCAWHKFSSERCGQADRAGPRSEPRSRRRNLQWVADVG